MSTKAINQPAKLLGASATILGTVPVNKEWDVRYIHCSNLDPINDHQITIFDYDPSGTDYPAEAAGAATTAIPAITLQKGSVGDFGPFLCPQHRVLAALVDAPGANLVNARIHGWESDA